MALALMAVQVRIDSTQEMFWPGSALIKEKDDL